jgi:hypothetical protein
MLPAFDREIRMILPLEEYLEQADKLAQGVVNLWAARKQGGTVQDPELDALFEKACLYRTAREIADNHRKHSVLIEHDEAEEKAARQAFAESCKAYYEKPAAKSQGASA